MFLEKNKINKTNIVKHMVGSTELETNSLDHKRRIWNCADLQFGSFQCIGSFEG